VNRYWFRPRRYGFGATPTTWEGWLSSLVFLVIVLAMNGAIIVLAPTNRTAAAYFVAGVVIVIVLFCLFAAAKTEGGWRWRWGRGDRGK
jgi:uncharacterized membrane protein YbhN (UPF0104 family)